MKSLNPYFPYECFTMGSRSWEMSVYSYSNPIFLKEIAQLQLLASKYSDAKLKIWLPLDEAKRQAMWHMVQILVPHLFVRVPFTTQTANGAFVNKAPHCLDDRELEHARWHLVREQGDCATLGNLR